MTAVYVNQCDKIRRTNEGELFWQKMINNKIKISAHEFINNVDTHSFNGVHWNEGETLADFMADDVESAFYKSVVYGQEVYFLYTSGFEFIFIDETKNTRLSSGALRVRIEGDMVRLL